MTDRPALGISLMLAFCVVAPLADAVAKLIGDRVPLLQILAIRFSFQAALLLPVAAFMGGSLRMPRHAFWLTGLRTLLHISGVGLMFVSLRFLPLADTIAITFVMPFILLLLGWSILGEEVGWRRLAACTVGFAGTLMVIQPSFAEVGLPAFFPLSVAVIFALFMLTTRAIAKDVDPVGMQAVSGLMAVSVLLPALILFNGSGFAELDPFPAAPGLWILLACTGFLGTVGHLFLTWALRHAPASTLAPMQYLEIPIATFFGWLIFSDLPNDLAALGIVVTVLAGLYIVWREQVLSRRAGVH